MLQDDFKALLWNYGGNLGNGTGRVDPEAAKHPELFLLAASNFIASDARIANCVFNVVIEIVFTLSHQALEEKMRTNGYDARRLGVLVSVIRDELNRRGSPADAERWEVIESNLRKELDTTKATKPFISHLPCLPGRHDPIFLAWGFEYPGIVREPKKYLRKAV